MRTSLFDACGASAEERQNTINEAKALPTYHDFNHLHKVQKLLTRDSPQRRISGIRATIGNDGFEPQAENRIDDVLRITL